MFHHPVVRWEACIHIYIYTQCIHNANLISPIPQCLLFVMKNLCSEERKIKILFPFILSSPHVCSCTYVHLIHNFQIQTPSPALPRQGPRSAANLGSSQVTEDIFWRQKTHVWALNPAKLSMICGISLSWVLVQSFSKELNIKQHRRLHKILPDNCGDTIKSLSTYCFPDPLGMKHFLDFYLLLS